MRSSIPPPIGLVVTLYLVADAAKAHDGLSPNGVIFAAIAVLVSLAPIALRRRRGARPPGASRVESLMVTSALALAALLGPSETSLFRDLVLAAATTFLGAIPLDLALARARPLPRLDRPLKPSTRTRLRPLMAGVALSAFLLGATAVLPVIQAFGLVVLTPPRFSAAPGFYALGALALAILTRLLDRPRAQRPEESASSAWALLGLVPALAAASAAAWLRLQGLPFESLWTGGLLVLAGGFSIVGHAASIDERRRIRAGRSVREAVGLAFAVAAASGVGHLAARSLGVATPPLMLSAGVAALLAVALLPILRDPLRRLLAPHGGRILEACERARDELRGASELAAIASATLVPLREASGRDDAMPLLLLVDPARRYRVDAAGVAHAERGGLPAALRDLLATHNEEIVRAEEFAARVVRDHDARPIAEALAALDAFALIPLRVSGELEGALTLPTPRRQSALSLEEIVTLRELGEQIAPLVAALGAVERAQHRLAEIARERDRQVELLDAQAEDLARMRAEAEVLRHGGAEGLRLAPTVAYSPAMQTLERELARVAPLEAPIALVVEAGVGVDRVARRIHAESARHEGPFVVGDCAGLAPDGLATALAGDPTATPPTPGWLRLAEGGSLLLTNVSALPLSAQALLRDVLAERQLRVGDALVPVDVRVLVSSRRPLAELAAGGTFDAELADRLSRLQLVIPPLRERREDLPSLALLAIDRAARVVGKPPLGISQEALDRLLLHEWPGNLRELRYVIEHAVRSCEGSQVTLDDLPVLATPSSAGAIAAAVELDEPDLLEGTFADVEARLLRMALERAAGNKSEAARLLDLKRTTFLDKLKRHGLNGADPKRSASKAAKS